MPIRNITENDIEHLVELHIDSFKESLNILAGKKYLSEVFRWFIKTNNIALLAYNGDLITGYVIGAPIGYEKAMNRALWIHGLTGLLKNPLYFFNTKLINNIIKRVYSILGISELTNQGFTDQKGVGISLVGIAVAEKCKGTGTAEELIIEFEKKAIELNADYMRLSVLTENKRAQKFYQRMSWIPLEVKGGYYYFKNIR